MSILRQSLAIVTQRRELFKTKTVSFQQQTDKKISAKWQKVFLNAKLSL